MGGQSTAATTNQTTVSTNTITDSYNQAFTRVENLSDVGNVNLNVSKGSGNPIILVILVAAFLGYMFIVKGKA